MAAIELVARTIGTDAGSGIGRSCRATRFTRKTPESDP